MTATFIETHSFTKVVKQYFASDEDYQDFQMSLLENPHRGDVMPGCGGLRKVRWRDIKRNKGARSGLRVIYLNVPDASRFLLLDVYNKDEVENLTKEERRQLSQLADEYRASILENTSKRKGHR